MSQTTLKITFPGLAIAEAGELAANLEQELRMSGEDLTVDRVRDNPDALDFGATLVLVLGTTAVTAVAKGIAAWMKRKGTSNEVKLGDKTVAIKDVDSDNLPGIIAGLAAMSSGTPPQP